jgi:dipeptidyl aminopeptidase/acylaminoacyl peptidase
VAIALIASLLGGAHAQAVQPLIPRNDFFGNPERAAVAVSPNGTQVAFLSPLDGQLNVWVAPVSDPLRARAVTHDGRRGIRLYEWAENSQFILYSADDSGAENYQLHAVDVSTGADRSLAARPGARADIIAESVKQPDEILVGLNDRDPRWQDVYRINVRTGTRSLVYKNSGVSQFVADSDFALRFAELPAPDGGILVRRFTVEGKLADYIKIPPDDSLITSLLGFDTANATLYALSSLGRDKVALVTLDPVTARQTILGASDMADVSDAIIHPLTGKVQAYGVEYLKRNWIAVDPAIRPDLAFIADQTRGSTWYIESRSNDDRIWTVSDFPPAEAPYYAIYDRTRKTFRRLFPIYPSLAGKRLAPMQAFTIKARDGLPLTAYLTLPDNNNHSRKPAAALPMVLWVHGGPWGRDSFGYAPYHQWLANRGYAVMSVNFRSSSGSG